MSIHAEPPFDWAAYDELVLTTPGIDHFCSSSPWVASANRFIHGPSRDASLAVDVAGVTHRLVIRRRDTRALRVLTPLEASWGLACPFLGPRPDLAVPELTDLLLETDGWHVLAFSGLPSDAPWVDAFADALARRVPTERGQRVRRHVANLSDGLDAYLARRSPRFRRNLRRALRVAASRGLAFERAHEMPVAALCARMQAVEDRSWKVAVGADYVPGGSFYGEMIVRLAATGSLRVIFARLDDEDVGYIFGGLLRDTYRGQQFSYRADLASLSLGNLLQWEQMRELVAAGVPRYDLGTTADHYKRRWADATVTSDTVRAVSPRIASRAARSARPPEV